MQIRPYTAADRKACLAIFMSNNPFYFDDSEIGDFERWLDGQDSGTIAYRNSNEEVYFVLEKDERIIACGGYYTTLEGQIAKITWGMVHSDYHKQGYGKALLLHRIIDVQKKYPKHSFALDTSQHTFRFFEKMDFVVERITENGYVEGMHRYDMILKPA